MTTLQRVAGYLPGLPADEVQWQTLRFSDAAQTLEVAVPQLTPAQLTALATHVRQAARQLKAMPVSQIIAAVDLAIERLLDPADPYRREAELLLPLVSGFDAEMVRLGLTSYLKTFRAPQLQRFVAEDFANPKVLDEFQPVAKGGWAKALGPELLVHVWAGNVPGLPLWSLICGLLVKAGNIGKVASAEPLFASLFARLLAEVAPALADCLAVVWWKGGDAASEQTLFSHADVVLAYGGNAALAQIRQQLPVTTRFLPHGHKLSFGMVSSAALDARRALATARQAALDVVRYDQQGCYSPHVFYVARGGRVSPREFAGYLASELAALQHKFARRALVLEEAASVATWRQSQELKGFEQAGAALLGEGDAAWCVAYAEVAEPLQPCALNRTVQVQAVDSLQDVMALIAVQREYLQSAGLAASPQELFALAPALGQAGVTRICALGAMSAPEAGWHHDGRFSLLDLVQLVEIEQSAETAAEDFAPYKD